jgi:hypothetical protein
MHNFKYILASILGLCFTGVSFAQDDCQENIEEKILLIGDSWAFFMDLDDTFNQVLPSWGHTDKTYYTNGILAENGATLEDFLEPEKLEEIEFQLQQKPDIEIIHLSLGGNDFLQNWNISFTDVETEDLKNGIILDLNLLISTLKSFRPDIQIVWSGYVYTNFEEIISAFFIPSIHPFYGTWEGMGFPDNESINEVLNDFSESILAITEADTQLDFVLAPGLMQNIFGQDIPLEIAPFGSYPPLDAPLPFGYVNYPSPQLTFRDYGAFLDCFHLSPAGYVSFIDYQTQKYYHKALMDDVFFIAENDNLNGSITENNSIEDDFIIGNFNNTEHKIIFNFPTENQLEFNTAAAEIFLRIKDEANLTEDLSFLVEVKSGFFGTAETIEINDFSFIADASSEVCFFGNTEEEDWLRLSLDASLLASINNENQTQVRISLAENTNAYIEFYNASNVDFAPVLNLTYGDEPSLSTSSNIASSLKIYPNPTTSKIYFSDSEILTESSQIRIFDMNGKELKPEILQNAVDISEFVNGTYILQIGTSTSLSQHKIIKY